MRVGFSDQALRLRLTHDEVQRLLAGKTVSAALSAPGLSWAMVLTAADGFAFVARDGRVDCHLPRDALKAFATNAPSRDSCAFEVSADGAQALSISVDVDIRSGPSRRPVR